MVMQKNWRFIISGKLPPATNMAIDEAILEGVIHGYSPQTVRVYDWDPPTVSLGFHQDIDTQIDVEKVIDYGFGIVRRPTGGRAVLHYDEVTYSVIARAEGRFEGTVMESYKYIAKILSGALRTIGIQVDIENGVKREQSWSAPCFSSASKYEIHYQGKKLVGSAQMRREGCFLQHGSILLNNDQSVMAEFIPSVDERKREHLRSLLAQKTISINQILNPHISFLHLAIVLKRYFEEELKIPFYISSTPIDFEYFQFRDSLPKYEEKFFSKKIKKKLTTK